MTKSNLIRWVLPGLAALVLSACGPQASIKPPPLELPTMTAGPQEIAPSATSPAAPTSTALPSGPNVIRLTDPGCCAQPFWSADSSMVLFLDKPEPTAKTAIYGLPAAGGTPPQIVSEQVGIPSPDGRFLTFLDEGGQTAIRETASGNVWTIDNGARRPFFSPTSQKLAWARTIEESSSDFSRRRTIVSVSNLDGSDMREAITVYGGGIGGWLDDNRLLLSGRLSPDDPGVTIFWLDLTDNNIFNMVQESRVRNLSVGPGGEWVLYTVALDQTNSANDGLWVVKTDGSQRFRVEVIGGARWRDPSHLLIIPLDPGAPSHRLWQFDATTGKAEPITNPDVTPFRVAQGDWSVSPNGTKVVFMNEADQALWVIELEG